MQHGAAALQMQLCPHNASCVSQPSAEGWLSGAGSLPGSAAYVLCMAMGRRRQRSRLHCSTLQHCLNKGWLSNTAPLTAARCLQLRGEAVRVHPHDCVSEGFAIHRATELLIGQ